MSRHASKSQLVDKGTFPQGSPAIWYELTKDKFGQQMSDVDALDSKLGVFLSAGSAVLGIELAVFALKTDRFTYWPIRLVAVAVVAYLALSVAALIALVGRRWAVGPNVLDLYAEATKEGYSDDQIKWKVTSRYQEDYEANASKFALKVWSLRLAVISLVIETFSVTLGLYATARPS